MLTLNIVLTLLRALVDCKYSFAEALTNHESSPSFMVIISTFIPIFFVVAWAYIFD